MIADLNEDVKRVTQEAEIIKQQTKTGGAAGSFVGLSFVES